MIRKEWIISLILCCITLSVLGQKNRTPKYYEEKGNEYYTNKKYLKALPYFLKHQSFKPKDMDTKLKIGVCYVETNRPEMARDYLEFLNGQKDPTAQVLFNLARTYHLQHDFELAIQYYKKYLAKLKPKDETRYLIKDEIKRCARGMKLVYKEKLALVENLGDKINTSYDDFAPVVSPLYNNILYFSSIRDGNMGGMIDAEGKVDTLKGDYRSDIYVSRLIKGEWTATAPLDERYNTVYHDIISDFSKDGNIVYYIQSKDMYLDYGELYMNNFLDEETSTPFKLPSPINSYDWDGDAYLFNDNTVVFSSDRKGGYGGKDLYISRKNAEGKWAKAYNLGKQINSAYDETTPFLARDGRTLYYSSNGVNSMGGFDIFVSTFNEAINNWSTPSNLGTPINTAADDAYFRMSGDGLRAFFASSRSDGYGSRDLYVAYFRKLRPDQATVSDSIVFQYALDNKLLAADVKAIEIENNNKRAKEENVATKPAENIPIYRFSPLFYDGNELLLTASSLQELNRMSNVLKKYPKLKVELSGHTDVDAQLQYNLFFSLKNTESVADYLMDNGITKDRILLKGCGHNYPIARSKNVDGSVIKVGQGLNKRIEMRIYRPDDIPILMEYNGPNLIDEMSVKSFSIYNKMIKGLSYKVQIKALKQMFDGEILKQYSDPLIETQPGLEYMRYSVGLFKSYTSANELKKQVQKRGFNDAFIVPYVNGERLNDTDLDTFKNRFSDLNNLIKAKEKK